MSGEPISQLNDALRFFEADLKADPVTAQRVEVSVIVFDDTARCVSQFVPAYDFRAPTLTSTGRTALAEAGLLALELTSRRLNAYARAELDSCRPTIFLLTDGYPTSSAEKLQELGDRIREFEAQKVAAFFAFGTDGADINRLADISVRRPLRIRDQNFAGFLRWVSMSVHRVSQSVVGQCVELTDPFQPNARAPEGWASL